MFDTLMVFRVVSEIASSLVIYVKGNGLAIRFAELAEVGVNEDGFLAGFGSGHELCLAGRERDGWLLLRAPTDGGVIEHEHGTTSGMLHGPV